MIREAYCWKCRRKTRHLVLNDGSEQAGQCLECGNGFVWNIDTCPHGKNLTKGEVEEYKASMKVFFGILHWAAEKEGKRVKRLPRR